MMNFKSIKYKSNRMETIVSVSDFVEEYVDIPKFLEACKECENYNKIWSCPGYDFDPLDIWVEYSSLYLVLVKFDFISGYAKLSDDETVKTAGELLKNEKRVLMDEFMEKEKEIPGSLSLSAGSCDLCFNDEGDHNCTRTIGKPCRNPEKLRYSIESLGGDVIRTAKDLFNIELKWSKGSKLPEYYILMCGLLD